MRVISFLSALVLASGASASAWAADLTKIDRTIAKEPAYKSKPKYCLLVFGPAAKTRVWLVLDGDVLYADRNGNGDLTEPGEKYLAAVKTQPVWDIGEIVEQDGVTRHTGLMVRRSRNGFTIHIHTAAGLRQEVGNELGRLQFATRSKEAPIVHLA